MIVWLVNEVKDQKEGEPNQEPIPSQTGTSGDVVSNDLEAGT